jgi:hypothetical protein
MPENDQQQQEINDLQKMVTDLQLMLNETREQHAISMSNELTSMRELVPYLIKERNELRGMVGNE